MNVIVYVVDSLRSDHVSCYGYERETTPNIDAVAEDGHVFENSFTVSTWTKEAAASILTGLYPSAVGVETVYDQLPSAVTTLPERLREAGFATAGISSTGHISFDYGFDAGFDTFEMETDLDAATKRELSEKLDVDIEAEYNFFPPQSTTLHGYLLDALDEADDDFFGLLWSLDVHDPYYVTEENATYLDGRRFIGSIGDESPADIRDVYDDMIRLNDRRFGELVAALKDRGEYDDTLLVIVGDHGEGFGDRHQAGHGNLPFREQIEVPFVLKPPDHDGTYDVDRPVQLTDILPTVYETTGLDVPPHVQGEPLGNRSRHAAGADRPIYVETRYNYSSDRLECVQIGSKKLIQRSPSSVREFLGLIRQMLTSEQLREKLSRMHHSYDLPVTVKRELYYLLTREETVRQLYDLNDDPIEQRDLLETGAGERDLDRLIDHLNEIRAENERITDDVTDGMITEIGTDTRQQLEDLGYSM